jgi:hypothetical protein
MEEFEKIKRGDPNKFRPSKRQNAADKGEIPIVLEDDGELPNSNSVVYEEIIQEFTKEQFPERLLHELRKRHVPKNKFGKVTKKFEEVVKRQADEVSMMDKLGKKDFPRLREKWIKTCQESLSRGTDTMSPLRDINHKIPLKDEDKHYHYHMPRCPDALKP